MISLMIISNRLGFAKDDIVNSMLIKIDEIQKMNFGLKSKLEKNKKK